MLLAVGGLLVWWRRPARPGLIVTALCVNVGAAALPFGWIVLQVATGLASHSTAGFVMTVGQPLVSFTAWVLLLVAAVAPPPATERSAPR